MTLSNKKANHDHIDRISDLPCNVIDDILARLYIKDLVKTSILSKKWRYMWTSVPRLRFDYGFFREFEDLDDPGPVASKVITYVLVQHKGAIHKFDLFVPCDYKFEITMEYIDTWIPILSRSIKHLELVNYNTHLDQMPYIVFSCKQLTYFKFAGFNLSIPPDFCGFKRLVNLHLSFVSFESHVLENLISACPLLETLKIEHCDGHEYLDIAASTLKGLWLEFVKDIKSICLKKANNLIDLTLVDTKGSVSGLIKSLPKNIERISIRQPYNTKIRYADIIPPTLLKTSFSCIKYLSLDAVNLNERGELLYIVCVLKSAPRLVALECDSIVDITQAPDHLEELECSCHCLNRLKIVNINVRSSSQHAMSLIRFILANSTSLETLTYKVGLGSKKLDAAMLLSIYEELLWMKRASQSAHVKFLH